MDVTRHPQTLRCTVRFQRSLDTKAAWATSVRRISERLATATLASARAETACPSRGFVERAVSKDRTLARHKISGGLKGFVRTHYKQLILPTVSRHIQQCAVNGTLAADGAFQRTVCVWQQLLGPGLDGSFQATVAVWLREPVALLGAGDFEDVDDFADCRISCKDSTSLSDVAGKLAKKLRKKFAPRLRRIRIVQDKSGRKRTSKTEAEQPDQGQRQSGGTESGSGKSQQELKPAISVNFEDDSCRVVDKALLLNTSIRALEGSPCYFLCIQGIPEQLDADDLKPASCADKNTEVLRLVLDVDQPRILKVDVCRSMAVVGIPLVPCVAATAGAMVTYSWFACTDSTGQHLSADEQGYRSSTTHKRNNRTEPKTMEATAHHQRHRRCPSCALVGLGKVYIPSSKDCGKVLLLQCTPVRNRTLCNSRHAPKDVVGQCCWTLCGAGYFSRLPLGSGATPNDANHTSNDSAHERRRSVASPAKKSSLRVKSSWSFRGVVAMNELGSLLHHRRRELAISQGWPRLRSARDPGFRIVSYNILAQGLVFRFATDPQIKAFPAALDEAYRWTLLFDQIRGMQADIVCLQEVGARTWQKYLQPYTEIRPSDIARQNGGRTIHSRAGECAAGVLGRFDAYFEMQEQGGAGFGMCVLFDNSKFDVLSANTLVYSSMFRGYGMNEYHQIPHDPGAPFTYGVSKGKSIGHGLAPWFRDIILSTSLLHKAGLTMPPGEGTNAQQQTLIDWINSFLKPSSRAQIFKVRCKKTNQSFIVANTHFHSSPTSPHVRILQAIGLVKAISDCYGANARLIICGDLNSTTETGAVEFLLRGHVSSNCMDWPIGGGAVMASTAQQGSTGVRQPSGSSVLSQSGADSPPSTVAALVAGVDRKQLTQDINAYLQIECPAADQNSTSTRANLEPSFKWSEYDQTRVEGNEENLFGYDTKTGRLVKQDVWAQSLRQDLAASSRTTMQTTRVVAKSEWALVHRYSRFAAPLAANVSQRARKIPSLNTIGCKSKLFLLPQLVFHPFQLASAYGYFPWSTHFATDFTGTLDWLLVDDRYFRVQRSLPVPHQSLLDAPGLPTRFYMSDHFALVSDVELKRPSNERTRIRGAALAALAVACTVLAFRKSYCSENQRHSQ